MKPQEVKADFIRLRASGYSYSVICEELHISKSTCVKWEKDNAEHIGELKRAAIAELCEQYGAAKEARVERLGRTLDRLNTAIEQADLSTIAPDKLLDLQLRYMDALKNEYTRLQPPAFAPEDATSGQAILLALGDLLNRVRAGDIPIEQVDKENRVLTTLLSAFEKVETHAKLEKLTTVLEQ